MFVNKCSGKILKLKWTDKIRDEQLLERTGQVPIQTEIGRRRWKWVGHTLRKGKNSITRQALQWNPQGSRGRGRPRETWRRCMEREMKDVGMTWVAKIRDEQLWERTGQVPIQTEIGRRRWKWVGHTLRKGKNNITRQALQWNPQGSRGRGRPRETWTRCMERDMKDVGMTWVALSKKAQDRDVWMMFVCGLYPDRGERQ